MRRCRGRGAPGPPPPRARRGLRRPRTAQGGGRPRAGASPRGRAARGEKLRGEAVLLGLGRLRRVAGAAEALPRRTVELVLAAVLAVGRDRRRVAARLALGDALERRAAAGAGTGIADAPAARRA